MIERAAAAGVQALELEAFAQNERALRLYRGRGVAVRHELHVCEGTIPSDPASNQVRPMGQPLVVETPSRVLYHVVHAASELARLETRR